MQLVGAAAVIAGLDAAVRRQPGMRAADARRVRRAISRELRHEPAALVLAVADALVERHTGFDRFFAYELVTMHPGARAALRPATVRRLGRGMDSRRCHGRCERSRSDRPPTSSGF